jgi:hypothetical protein
VTFGTIVLVLAHAMAGCSSDSSPTPLAPSPAAQPVPSYTLSGVVLAMTPAGLAPVEGASVQMNLTKPAVTDVNGFYNIPGLTLTGLSPNTAIGHFNTVTTWKPAYVNDSRTVTVSGDTRLDIEIVRRVTFTLSGVVSEMTDVGLTPIEGVRIDDWSCDPVFPGNRQRVPSDGCSYGLSHSTTTDKQGRYSVPAVYATQNFICATKEGYQGSSNPSECEGQAESLTVDGDTRFDIRLVRR